MASEGGTEIPPEIITNILYRLPSKSLGRFRCVSKSWLVQISESQFIKNHRKTLNRNHLICDSDGSSLYSLPFNQHDEKPKNLTLELAHAGAFIFHGSCNGLVLASVDDHFDSARLLVVFNPTTSELVQLPEIGFERVTRLLGIDIMYGFGYDSLTDDYKVVTVTHIPDYMSVHIYSLRYNFWRGPINCPSDHSYSHGECLSAVFVNGFLHWIANKSSDNLPVIAAFSLADETFSEVPSPNLGVDVDIMSKSDCKLVVLAEKLAIFLEYEVWLMNEYGVKDSWSKILIRGLSEIPMVEPKIFYDDGKIWLVSGDLMWMYDVEDKSFCKTIDISWDINGLKVIGTYVESLVSPNSVKPIRNW